jgi:hypothetical protein
MKNVFATCFFALFTLGLTGLMSCNQNAAPAPAKPKVMTEEEFNKTEGDKKVVAKPNSDQTNLPLKDNMQGRWKSMSEKNVTYEIKDAEITKMVNDKPTGTSDITFANDCGLTCGAISKKVGSAGHAGCMSIRGKTEECLWVLNFAHEQVSFYRMGGVKEEPEIWVRM